MANGFTHELVGGLTGLSVVITKQGKEQPINLLLAINTGTFFAKLPDILESATNPHSLVVFAAIGNGVKKVCDWKPEDRSGKFWRAAALSARCLYPRSLPVIGQL